MKRKKKTIKAETLYKPNKCKMGWRKNEDVKVFSMGSPKNIIYYMKPIYKK